MHGGGPHSTPQGVGSDILSIGLSARVLTWNLARECLRRRRMAVRDQDVRLRPRWIHGGGRVASIALMADTGWFTCRPRSRRRFLVTATDTQSGNGVVRTELSWVCRPFASLAMDCGQILAPQAPPRRLKVQLVPCSKGTKSKKFP